MSNHRLVDLALVTTVVALLAHVPHFLLNTNLAYGHNSTPPIQEDSLAVTVAPSTTVNRGEIITITATVLAHRTGAGTLDTNWNIQLTIPSEYTLTSGANPQTETTNKHGSATVTWQVAAPSVPSSSAQFTVTASATDASTSTELSGSPETDTFTITTVNRVPTANNDTISIPEDTAPVVIDVLSNDTDDDNDTLLISSITQPSNGTAQMTDGNTTITYYPDTDFFGMDSISYTIEDGFGGSDIGTMVINVTSVNDPPVALNDSYEINEDTLLNVGAPGVFGNDTDIEGDDLSTILIGNVENGTLVLYSNGSFSYLPTLNFNGQDSFTYIVNDGTDNSSIATVNITINPANDPPVTFDDSYIVDEDETLEVLTVAGVLANDTDIEGDILSTILIGDVADGILTLNENGSFTYSPDANFNGVDSFTYIANDGLDNSTVATVSIVVNPVEEEMATEDEDDKDEERDRTSNNRRENEEEDLAAKRLTYEDTYFDDKPLKRVQIQSHSILNSDGASFSTVSRGEKVTFSYGFRNYQQESQQYCFIVEIIDNSGMTISLLFSKGELGRGGKAEVEQKWMTNTDGEYTAKVFIWDSLDSPLALSDTRMSAFKVT